MLTGVFIVIWKSRGCANLVRFLSIPGIASGGFLDYEWGMPKRRTSIRRILAVGNPPGDQVKRLTRGENFTCVNGSEVEHERLRDFCLWLETCVGEMGIDLSDLSREELALLLSTHAGDGPRS